MDELNTYIDVLFEGLEGFVYSPVKTTDSWNPEWFEYPRQRVELIEHIRKGGGDVYISPAVYNEKRATKDSVKKTQCVWVEFDGNDKIDFKQVSIPNLIVQTSFASHVHCYWKIGPTNQTAVENANRRLTYYLQADSSGWDITQLLRPPGTINHKHNLPVVLADFNDSLHTVGEFGFVPEPVVAATETVLTEHLLDAEAILREHQLPLKVNKMVLKEIPVEPYRSSFLARLANELAEEDLSHLEIVSLLKEVDSRIKKYEGRSDQLVRLSQIADYAIHKRLAEEQLVTYSLDYILNHVDSLQWVLPQWLHTTGQMIISGAPGVGKTQWLLQLGVCLANGESFLGMPVNAKHKVFCFSLEMDKSSLKEFLSKQKREWNSIPSQAYFTVVDESASLMQYENLIAEHESNIVLIDSMLELFDDMSDNPNSEARKVMKWCRKIRRRYGVAIVLIHHNRKATEGNKKPKGLADLVGSFQFAKDTETVLQLWHDQKGIELSGVKVRFGMKDDFMITRNENLWYTRDASNTSGSIRANTARDTPKSDSGNRHGNSVHGSATGKVSFGSSGKNGS